MKRRTPPNKGRPRKTEAGFMMFKSFNQENVVKRIKRFLQQLLQKLGFKKNKF